jgi:hypothetical protein
MAVKLKLLQVALAEQNYDLAAHALVYGMVKVKAEQNDKKRRTKGQPKRS